jgi:hypothetical protein
MRLLYLIMCVVALNLVSCNKSDKLQKQKGSISLTGIASILADHSNKANCPGIIVDGEEYLFRGDFKDFGRDIIGKKVSVTGVIKKEKLPMFIYKKGELPKQGIPMPPGTDIEKEKIFFTIENPKWKEKE